MTLTRNVVNLTGHSGSEPKIKKNGSGGKSAVFNLATHREYLRANGQCAEDKHRLTDWHRVVVYGSLAKFVGQHVAKGQLVDVIGRLHTRSWKDENGEKRFITEVVAERVLIVERSNKSKNEKE